MSVCVKTAIPARAYVKTNNAVTCHNQPADARAFLRPRVVLADHVGLLAAGSREI